MDQLELIELIGRLKRNEALVEADFDRIVHSKLSLHQIAPISVLLARKQRSELEERFLQWSFKSSADLQGAVQAKYPDCAREATLADDWICKLFHETHCRGNIGAGLIKQLISKFVAGRLKAEVMAAWLMIVLKEGLGADDTLHLTRAMKASGRDYNYKEDDDLASFTFIRRYPTGGVSEKAALILPSLIAAASAEFKVVSPFLVARSLSHTGGTWDKLSSVKGFVFPEPGDQTAKTLASCGVAMTVTSGDFNPADRLLYQLRSATGTVDSHELMLSSIASKQMAVFADYLLMDVRFGQGAFLKSIDEAHKFSRGLEGLICQAGIKTFSQLTDTPLPGGAAIGNALEVAEAVAILGGQQNTYWDERWLLEQKSLAIEFFCKLMSRVHPSLPSRHWARIAQKWLSDGTALAAFKRILVAHAVPPELADNLATSPFTALNIPNKPIPVTSSNEGLLTAIDQIGLGNYVNFVLNGGGNQYSNELDPTSGLILTKRLGDPVQMGDALCLLFTNRRVEHLPQLLKCFSIGQ
jgi:pyrimidine-nucleoside phosphorylase